jgi:hypothetical protein
MGIKNSSIFPQKNTFIRIIKMVGAILLIPLFGNIFVAGWKWSAFDFVFAFVLLLITSFAIDFAIRMIRNPISRFLVVGAIVFGLLALWVELATGGVSSAVERLF